MLILLSGCSGAGKNTVIDKLLERNKNLCYLKSCTSRVKEQRDIELHRMKIAADQRDQEMHAARMAQMNSKPTEVIDRNTNFYISSNSI